MSKQKTLYVGIVLVMLLSLIVSCGESATPTPTAAPTKAPAAATAAPSGTQAAQPTTAAAATQAPAIKLADKQTLRVNINTEPPTLDPSLAEDSAAITVLKAVQDGLIVFKPDLTIEPGLASKWDISTDGKKITFTLRDGIKYSDGVAIKAGDFVYALRRLADPRTAAPYNFILSPIKGADEFTGAQVPTDTAKLPDLEKALGVSAPDDKTVVIELKEASTYFPFVMALWCTSPLRKDVIDKGGKNWTEPANYVSTGAFMVKEWKHQEKITLVPNPNYYGTKPTLTEITINMIADEKAALEAYKNNELDIVAVPLADIKSVKADAKLSKEVLQMATLGTYFLEFNTRVKPFDNKGVRQAFSQAVDRQTLVDVVTSGLHVPALSLVPPGMMGYQPNIGFKYDPAKAKAALAAAGYPDGKGFPETTLLFNSPPVPGHKPLMEFVQANIKQNLNIDIKLQAMEWGAYLDLLKTGTQPGINRMGWNADFPHPQNFLDMIFNSKSIQNHTGWKNAEFDKLCADANKESDVKKQEALYNKAQELLVEEAPVIFVYYYGRIRLIKPWVADLVPTSMDSDVPGGFFWDRTKIAAH